MDIFLDKETKSFENIKHLTDEGIEFWYARELQEVLEYTQWRNLLSVINKAKTACINSGNNIPYHFADVSKMVKIGSETNRKINDIKLSRYACYLIVQNGDTNKDIIALGQTYFAIKTRQQELIENYDLLTEEQKRVEIRNQIRLHNKTLAEAANNAGVKTDMDYAVFQNKGYQGLYGGLGVREIHIKKGLNKSQKILDHMGATELAANLFRATQTDEKLRRDKIQGKENAGDVHYKVGTKIRQTIKELGGTMPENLPTPKKSVKEIENELEKKSIK
jgi:DNA-damage-inducible protein D